MVAALKRALRASIALTPALASGQAQALPAPIVILDPGHGGHDSGAVAIDGSLEKDVVLAIARCAAAALTKSDAVDVRLTRDDDRFISLQARVDIARRRRAALFLSIHADSAPGTGARGWTLYSVSDAASDLATLRLARRENAAVGPIPAGLDDDTAYIVADLVSHGAHDEALRFADELADTLTHDVSLAANPSRAAAFWVLKAAEVPSLLLETGYLSDARDVAYLKSEKGCNAIGSAIGRAVLARLTGRAIHHQTSADHG